MTVLIIAVTLLWAVSIMNFVLAYGAGREALKLRKDTQTLLAGINDLIMKHNALTKYVAVKTGAVVFDAAPPADSVN